MRGKRPEPSRNRRPRRLIPAHAGKTKAVGAGRRCQRAHPRACGENIAPTLDDITVAGSSPRMRGKLIFACMRVCARGLIPAHAGKTRFAVGSSLTWPAHPRACGENSIRPKASKAAGGSSPRMRGKRSTGGSVISALGLIPAHAGKTQPRYLICLHARAHPRACGENLGKMFFQISSAGSSPRMRGKPKPYCP